MAVTAIAVRRGVPIWRLEDEDLARMMLLGLGGAAVGTVLGGLAGRVLSYERRSAFEGALIVLTFASGGILAATLAGLPRRLALGVGLTAGLVLGGLMCWGVDRQRERDLADLLTRDQAGREPRMVSAKGAEDLASN